MAMSDVPGFPAPDPASRWEPSAPIAPARPRRRARWFLLVLLPISLFAAGMMFAKGNDRASDVARDLVRISAGCRVPVTLQRGGQYWVYVETGPVPMPETADCSNAGRLMSNPHGFPVLGFAIATPNGVERSMVEVDPNRKYTAGRHSGLLTSRFEATAGETVIVGVVADSRDAAIAIGDNVFDVRKPWRIGAGVILVLGLLLSGVVVRVTRVRDDA